MSAAPPACWLPVADGIFDAVVAGIPMRVWFNGRVGRKAFWKASLRWPAWPEYVTPEPHAFYPTAEEAFRGAEAYARSNKVAGLVTLTRYDRALQIAASYSVPSYGRQKWLAYARALQQEEAR